MESRDGVGMRAEEGQAGRDMARTCRTDPVQRRRLQFRAGTET